MIGQKKVRDESSLMKLAVAQGSLGCYGIWDDTAVRTLLLENTECNKVY